MIQNTSSFFDATRTIVVKTNNACNLQCSYCYEEFHQQIPHPKLNKDTANVIFDKLSAYCMLKSIDNLNIIWHGGEPMLMGVDFYRQMIELEKKCPVTFNNLMQTNGTFLNDEWLDFFVAQKFKIGISFDGSPRSNKIHRQCTERVVENLKKMNQWGLHPSVICVVSDSNYSYCQELFDFFNTIETEYIDLVPCYENNKKYSLSSEHYVSFFTQAFDRWLSSGKKPTIRLFSNITDMILGRLQPHSYVTCSLTGRCGEIISIDTNGDIYFCDCLPKEKKHCIGNLNDDTLYVLSQSNNYSTLRKLNAFVPEDCRSCQYRMLCGKGCLTRRTAPSHTSGDKDYYCRARIQLFSHIQKALGVSQLPQSELFIPTFTRGPQPDKFYSKTISK